MNQAGKTLIELMFVIAICALVASQVSPSLSALYQRSQSTVGINWIVGAINFSRLAAVERGVTVTLCPAEPNALECKNKWHQGLIIFADFNQDARFNGKDYLIARVAADQIDGTLTWRAFRNRQYLQMTPFGYTNYQNGNFVFCPATSDPKFARQIVVNVQGRARLIHKKNTQGLPVDRRGRPLRC